MHTAQCGLRLQIAFALPRASRNGLPAWPRRIILIALVAVCKCRGLHGKCWAGFAGWEVIRSDWAPMLKIGAAGVASNMGQVPAAAHHAHTQVLASTSAAWARCRRRPTTTHLPRSLASTSGRPLSLSWCLHHR